MLNKEYGLLFLIFILTQLILYSNSMENSNLEFTDSNQGANSNYIFSFTPSLSYTYVDVVITFPIEYSISSFTGSLECFYSNTGVNSQYMHHNCWVDPDITTNK